jgi:hypothetical protein
MTTVCPSPFKLVAGLTSDGVFTYYANRNADTGDPENPVDLTAYTAASLVFTLKPGGAALLSLTVGSGITLGGAAGTITWEGVIPSTMSGRRGFWSLELTDAGATEKELVRGRWIGHERVQT